MLVPRVKFFELNQVVAPIRPNVRNRIGIVGEFTRGPSNQFRFIGGYSDFASTYGSDTRSGSMAFQSAWDQGAKEFAAVRVLGRAKPAYGEIDFSGISTKNNTILLSLKFMGEALNQGSKIIKTDIFTSGSYLGSTSGRYWFNVREIDEEHFCYIDYTFIPLGVEGTPWWGDEEPPLDGNNYIRVRGTAVLNLEEDYGVPIAVDQGLFMSFGTLNQTEAIDLDEGDTWSIRVNSNSFKIPIYEEASPNQVITAFREALQGVDPLGLIKSNDFDNGVIFELMEELEGAIGNKYTYHVDLAEPDGEVICEASFFEGEKYIQIPIEFATYIQEGADVEIIEGNGIYTVMNISDPANPQSPAQSLEGSIIQPLTKVTRVEVPQFQGGGLAVVWLDKEISSSFNSIGVFRFVNPNGIKLTNYTHYNYRFMTGGEDGPRRAFRDLYTLTGIPLVRLIATSEGAWGNSVRVDVFPISRDQIRISIRDLNKASYNPPIDDESFLINLSDTDSEGQINVLKESRHIRGIFLPKAINRENYDVGLTKKSPMRLAPADPKIYDAEDPRHSQYYGPNRLKSVSLEEGYDGPPPSDEDYTRAFKVIADYPVHILIAPGVWESDVIKHSMISQAESSTELEGLRIAVLNAAPLLRPEAAKAQTVGYDSNRAVMVAGWATYAGQPNAPRFGLSPDGVYAGKLASIPFFVKPCARSSAGPVFGVSEVDTYRYSSMSHLQIYTDARLEILAMDPALLTFNFINGRTLATNTAWDQIQIRRTYDMIRGDLFLNLQQYKSEPNTSLLRRQMATAVDAYMSTRARNGEISGFQPTLVQSPDVTTGVVDVYVSFLPLYAADYINVYLRRDSSGVITSV